MLIDDLKNKPSFRKSIVDSMCSGLVNTTSFKEICDYVIDEKSYIFDNIVEFSDYYNEDDTQNLILPAVRRVWGLVFSKPPSLLKEDRLFLFYAFFDIDEFLDYFMIMIKDTKGCLSGFDNLDRTAEHLSLIVDNYIALLVKKVKDEDGCLVSKIRDINIKKVIK